MKTLKILTTIIFISANALFADGLIIIPRPEPLPTPYPLEVLYHHVNVKINSNIAETSIDQAERTLCR